MTQIWDDQNRVVPVTVLQVAPVPGRAGQDARARRLQRPAGHLRPEEAPRKLTKPVAGQFAKAGVEPGPTLVELRLDDVSGYEVGQEISVDILAEGDLIDVTAVSKGKGFAGVMKRHGFAGQRASHGAHRVHRAPGAIGACATPARVFKGQRMAGRMGGEKVTTLNLEVVQADAERDLLLVKGAVPGPKGGLVLVRNAVKAAEEGWPDGHHRRARRQGQEVRLRRARRRRLRHRAQRAGACTRWSPPSSPPAGPAPRAPRPAPRSRRRRQALEAEGHRPRPPGLDPLAAVARRRRGPRAQAPQLRPAHPQEDDPPGPALGPVRPGRRGQGRWSSTWGFDAPKTKEAVAALGRARRRGPGARGRCGAEDHAALEELPQPRPTSTSSTPGELNAYDVLCHDWVVFTQDTLPTGTPRRAPRPPGDAADDAGSRAGRGADEASEGACVTPRRDPAAGREREVLRAARGERVHVRRRTPTPRSPRSTTPSSRSSASRSPR